LMFKIRVEEKIIRTPKDHKIGLVLRC
jgi:hypothetical protein